MQVTFCKNLHIDIPCGLHRMHCCLVGSAVISNKDLPTLRCLQIQHYSDNFHLLVQLKLMGQDRAFNGALQLKMLVQISTLIGGSFLSGYCTTPVDLVLGLKTSQSKFKSCCAFHQPVQKLILSG